MILKQTTRHRLATVLMVAALSTSAFAHARPKVANPAPDSTVSAPKEVSIVFTEAVDPKFSSLELLDVNHKAVATSPTVADPADHAHLSLHVPSLAPGMYYIHWVTAAVDGHHLDGTYAFTVK